jgi:hypothetical protein
VRGSSPESWFARNRNRLALAAIAALGAAIVLGVSSR